MADAGHVYVYGVLAAADAPASGPGGRAAQVRASRTAAWRAGQHLEGDALAAAREVRAHWRVLDAASTGDRAAGPVRDRMEGEQAVRERLLEPNAERIEALLDESGAAFS